GALAGRRRAHTADQGRCRGRDFVEAVGGMDDHATLAAEPREGLAEGFNKLLRVYADELALRAGRVGEGAEEVEDGGEAEALARGGGELHRGVMIDGEGEAHPRFLEAAALDDGRRADVDAEAFQDFRGAAAGAGAAAVLGDEDADLAAGGGGDEGGGGGD